MLLSKKKIYPSTIHIQEKRYNIFGLIEEISESQDNNLIDGYTTYLIAKKYNFNNIEVQVKIGGNKNEQI